MTTDGAAAEDGVFGRIDASSLTQPYHEITPEAPDLILPMESENLGGSVETELLDLSEVSLSVLRQIDDAVLSSSVRRIMTQVDRPRANLGGSGPPGRVD
jgi:hypothetical protein